MLFGRWMKRANDLGVGCWLLAVGCWLLAVGCWQNKNLSLEVQDKLFISKYQQPTPSTPQQHLPRTKDSYYAKNGLQVMDVVEENT